MSLKKRQMQRHKRMKRQAAVSSKGARVMIAASASASFCRHCRRRQRIPISIFPLFSCLVCWILHSRLCATVVRKQAKHNCRYTGIWWSSDPSCTYSSWVCSRCLALPHRQIMQTLNDTRTKGKHGIRMGEELLGTNKGSNSMVTPKSLIP